MKQKPRMNMEQSKKPLLLTSHNILYDENDLVGRSHQKGKRGQNNAMLKSIVSPTAVVDDDLPYSGIEMPAYQPTVKLAKVISESAYSSQGRVHSHDSRKS